MKKTIILLLTVVLILASCKQQIAPPQEPNTYTVTFVAGNTTIATKTYNEGEKLYTKLSEDHYIDTTKDEFKSYDFKTTTNNPAIDEMSHVYTWETSLETEVTSDRTIEGTGAPITALVFYNRKNGDVVDFVAQPGRIEKNKSTAPAIPVKEGYEGYWEYNDNNDPVIVSSGSTRFVYPYYYSVDRHDTGMPKSIIMTNGQAIWIYGEAIENVDASGSITFAKPTASEKGKGRIQYGFSISDYEYSLNEETRTEYRDMNPQQRTDLLISAGKEGIVELIKELRDFTGNNTWSIPTEIEGRYIGKALAQCTSGSKYLENMLQGSPAYAGFHTINQTDPNLEPIYQLRTNGSLGNPEKKTNYTLGYFWPISYQPIGE